MRKAKAWLDVAGGSDPGCVRPNNEDSFAIDPESGLLAVADGMGGHNSGEVASALATSTIRDFVARLLASSSIPVGGTPGLTDRGRQLECAVQAANTVIYEKGRAFPQDAGMGTTVVAALVSERSLTVACVGDSRLYLHRRGELSLLTEDHSIVADQVRKGLITPEQAARSSLQNILTRALGSEKDVKVDVADHPLLPDDVVLLASDGLTKMVPDAGIERALGEGGPAQAMVDRLIALARAAGGIDNVTVIVARAPGGDGALHGLVSRIFGKRGF